MLIREYTHHDGAAILEIDWSAFSKLWSEATNEDKSELVDGRPALRNAAFDDGLPHSYTTIAQHLWDDIKTRGSIMGWNHAPPRVRLCKACNAELKMEREHESHWIFNCARCRTNELWAKSIVGGTIGQGRSDS